MMKHQKLSAFFMVALLMTNFLSSTAFSQPFENPVPSGPVTITSTEPIPEPPDKSWHFLIEPYFMFTNMMGEVRNGNAPSVIIDENPGDIFDNLQTAGMLYLEAHNDKWSITSDVSYMELDADASPRAFITAGRVQTEQLRWELAMFRKVSDSIDIGLGAILYKIDVDTNFTANSISQSRSISETWVDPTIILRSNIPLSETWSLLSRVNLSGFGVGSNFSWQFQIYGNVDLTDHLMFSLGYRTGNIDYDNDKSGSEYFDYYVATFGPVIGLGFNF